MDSPVRPRLRLQSPVIPENEFQESVVRALDTLLLPPAIFTALNMGHVQLTAAQASRVRRMGCKAGFPDLVLFHQAKSYGIELKRPGTGRLSKSRWERTRRGGIVWRQGQEETFAQLAAAGMQLAICTDMDELLAQLRRWGIPLRATT